MMGLLLCDFGVVVVLIVNGLWFWFFADSGYAIMVGVQFCVYKVFVAPLPPCGGWQLRVEVAHAVP